MRVERTAALEWLLAQGTGVTRTVTPPPASLTLPEGDGRTPIITVAGFTLTREEWEELDDESVSLLLQTVAEEIGALNQQR
jgi:hypothetical protein